MTERKLPTIQQLANEDSLPATAKQNAFNVLVNQQPPASWVKPHPMASNVKYLPIERVEFLLTSIFINWHVEIRTVQTMANSIVVTVRLHYQCPITGNMLWHDGVGASPIDTDKGAGAMDWNKVKRDSVMKAAPAAETYAVKDAAEKIGRLFGKDLNRKVNLNYDNLLDQDRFKDAKITE